MEQRKETEEIKRQKESEGFNTYLDENIFGDDDIFINVAANELSEWQTITF